MSLTLNLTASLFDKPRALAFSKWLWLVVLLHGTYLILSSDRNKKMLVCLRAKAGSHLVISYFIVALTWAIIGVVYWASINALYAQFLTDPRSMGSEISNEQLKDSALALARRMRQLQSEVNAEQNRILSSFSARLANPPESEKETAAHREDVMAWMRQKQTDLKSTTDSRFGPLRAEARNTIFHMMNRIPPPQPVASEMVSICLSTGPCAGPDPYGNVADYIEQLANLVPVKR